MDLLEIWNALWKGKWVILAVSALVTAAAATYAFTAEQWYRSEVLLSPAAQKSGQGFSGQLGGLGGLAALAGINIGSAATSAEPLAVLKSREFARAFIEEQNLITVLLAKDWDAQARRWKATYSKRVPDIRDAVKYFDEHVRSVNEDKKTGLVTLSVEWTDAQLAAKWANLLADRLNERLRQRALADADANVKFLREELASTNVVTLQQSIGRLLESELEKLMVARGNQEFAYRVVDHAEVAKWRARPKRVQSISLGAIGGGMLGVFIVFARYALSVRRRPGAIHSTESTSNA